MASRNKTQCQLKKLVPFHRCQFVKFLTSGLLCQHFELVQFFRCNGTLFKEHLFRRQVSENIDGLPGQFGTQFHQRSFQFGFLQKSDKISILG